MSNIDKFLGAMQNWKGETLVIEKGRQITIVKDSKDIPIIKKELDDKEFEFLINEYKNQFGDKDEVLFNGTKLYTSLDDKSIIFSSVNNKKTEEECSEISEEGDAETEEIFAEEAEEEVHAEGTEEIVIPQLLHKMVEIGASDLHLSTGVMPYVRIDGDMKPLYEYKLCVEENLKREIDSISPQINIQEFQETNDTDFAYEIEGLARFRTNVFRDNNGVGAVFRVIPSEVLTVEQLSIPAAMVDLCKKPKGLILVTGPTGSGKSTTLAALIDHINKTQRKHIITVEDPVEFVHKNRKSLINQREIFTHTASFKRSLKAALREDPDIILVGEMRDLETIAIAIEMAATGHLVFGTLHTSTAIATVDRIIDQFPADRQDQIKTMLADSLAGVVSQTLLKRKEGGRVGAYEVLISTVAVANLIREGKNFQIATLMQTGKSLGMQMINTHLTELVEKGVVEAQEAVDKAVDKDNLIMQLKGRGLYSEPE